MDSFFYFLLKKYWESYPEASESHSLGAQKQKALSPVLWREA